MFIITKQGWRKAIHLNTGHGDLPKQYIASYKRTWFELLPLWICQITGMGPDQSFLKPSSKQPHSEFLLLIYSQSDRGGEEQKWSEGCSVRDAQSCLRQNSFY